MKTNSERARDVYFGAGTGTMEMIDAIENALDDACSEAVAAREEEIVAMLTQQQKRFLPAEGAYHVLESIKRDHIRTRSMERK